MGDNKWTRTVLEEGDKQNFPKPGDNVAIHYTGWLYDPSQPENKGKKFDSSYDRKKPLEVRIGVEQVIKGWDEGVPEMSLGERSILNIPGGYAYGAKGFPGLIPPNATLLFDVKLVELNGKKASS